MVLELNFAFVTILKLIAGSTGFMARVGSLGTDGPKPLSGGS
jgi:hypothetical protein